MASPAKQGCGSQLAGFRFVVGDIVQQPRRRDLGCGVVVRTSEDTPGEGESAVHKDWVCVEFEQDVMCVPVNQLVLFDRFMDCGSRVARCDQGVGLVTNVCTQAVVRVGDQDLPMNTKDLRPTRELCPGLIVTLDGWMGRIVDVSEVLTLAFQCGAVGAVKVSEKHMHQEKKKALVLEPGEHVIVVKDYLREANWVVPPDMSRVKKSSDAVRGLINRVEVDQVRVAWHQRALGAAAAPPPEIVSGADLSKLRTPREFIHTGFRVGDYALVPRPAADGQRRGSAVIDRPLKTLRAPEDGDVGRIVSSKTTVTVMWPSGEVEGDVGTLQLKLLPPIKHLASALVVPGMPVLHRKDQDDHDSRVGITQMCNCKERITVVKWFDQANLQRPYTSEPPAGEVNITSESTFDLVKDEELVLTPGDYVMWDGAAARPLAQSFGEVVAINVDGSADVVWFDRSATREFLGCLALVNPDTWEDEAEEDESDEAAPTRRSCAINALRSMIFKRRKLRAVKPIFSEEYHVNTKFTLLDEDPVHHSFYSRVMEKNFCPREAFKQVAAACNLPAGVQVFSYSSRMDLLRAVVFGKPGSLYDGGVFIFDLHIPADFPRAPPEVRYVPLYKNKVNPSLHDDGKVCMSILRTSHTKCGGWQNCHTITQILACIQSGLLNNDPLSGTDFHCPNNSSPFHEDITVSMIQGVRRIMTELRRPDSKVLDGVDRAEIFAYLRHAAVRLLARVDNLLSPAPTPLPFSLLPLSEGLERTLRGELRAELARICQTEVNL